MRLKKCEQKENIPKCETNEEYQQCDSACPMIMFVKTTVLLVLALNEKNVQNDIHRL
jgi:hypothetical protein